MKIDPDSKLAKEVWICSDATILGADGTKDKPFIAKRIETILSSLGSSCVLRLKSGAYTTNGFSCPDMIAIIGESQDTTIRLADDSSTANRYPQVCMFSEASWCSVFYLYNLTLDGNYTNQKTGRSSGNFKVQPACCNCTLGKLEKLKIIGFGASGKQYGAEGFEAFPASLTTISNGPPFAYLPMYQGLIGKEDQSFLEIVDCDVSQPTFDDGGYCTAAFVKTTLGLDKGDRQPFRKRTTLAARVANNVLRIPGGIALGSASSEQILFTGNTIIGTKAGFNFDTGEASNITIERNTFLNVSQGINFTPSVGDNIVIRQNTFIMGDSFYNPVLKRMEDSYAVRLRNTPGNVKENYVVAPSASFMAFDGVPNDGSNKIVAVGDSGNTTQLQGQIQSLTGSLATAQASASAFKSRITALEQAIRTAANAL